MVIPPATPPTASSGRSANPSTTTSTTQIKHVTVRFPAVLFLSTAPLSSPANTASLQPTVSWDTSFFPSANSTTLKILGFYVFNNTVIPTTGPPSGKEEAFNSGEVPAAWGYWDWKLKRELLETQSLDAVNITLRMVALPRDGSAARWLAGPTVTLQYRPQPPPKPKKNKAPAGEQELYIALPAVFGFAGLMIVGTFFWNRQVRAIGVGNIMGRGRRLRTAGSGGKRREGLAVGMGASKKDRARNKEQAIRLMERDGAGTDSEGDDWDQGWGQDASGRSEEGVEKGPGKGKRVFERLDRKRM